MAELSDGIKELGDATSAVFRHLVPGVFILGVASIIRPELFSNVDVAASEWLILLSVLAITVGNIWFVAHRYLIQQMFDVLFWVVDGRPGGDYHKWVADRVHLYFRKDVCTSSANSAIFPA